MAKAEFAKQAHNCQANSTHRLSKGDLRLAVKKDRSWENYCVSCGKRILEADAEKLKRIMASLEVKNIE